MPIPNTWKNPVRETLESGKPVVGATITTASVEAAAQAAQLGFDFLWIEMEHSPITLETLRNIVLATRGLAAVPFARVPVVETWTAKRVLDMGAMGVIFPFASTPDLALTAANACKYPPAGNRGYGPGLATFRWQADEGYADFADRNVMVVAMIEEQRAVERIDEIAATPGIDVLFIGTSDLSFSMGLRGRQDEPALERALDKVVNAARKHGKFAGRPAIQNASIPKFIEQGFQFIQAPSELRLMAEGAKPILDLLGKTGVTNRAMY
ncbi:MAG TPA: aldolase/citrate lyase family protein [Bryobacteraceae bacterium]|nr:aldolase/citrate lyase family protein [Bryobacteraceae bacterium]